jgi:hypothetical protein
MKKLICTIVLGGLISTGVLALSFGKPEPHANGISIDEVLQAHNVARDPGALSTWLAEAVKLTSYAGGPESDFSNFFERKVTVVVDGDSFKRRRADPLGLREQVDLFDGQLAHHSVKEKDWPVDEEKAGDSQFAAAQSSIRTFGLVPILRRLSDPATDVVYAGRTARKEDKFKMKTATGDWTLYCDQQHTICRVEIGDKLIEYADYRSVEGVRLPFIQRLSFGGRLIYELVFTRIEFKPVLPSGYFTREAV